MTRSKLNRVLFATYVVLGIILALAVIAKLGNHIPGIADTAIQPMLADLYEYLRDMSIVVITLIAAYLANVFQKRASFSAALEREWRNIVKTKTALLRYTRLEAPTREDYDNAYCPISEALDNMRTVYRNVGETNSLIGLYPYSPLHDMRRAIQTLNPDKTADFSPAHRKLVRQAIMQAFYALRESFLDELDLQQPDRPILSSGARRLKKPGAKLRARVRQDLETRRQVKGGNNTETNDVTEMLRALREREGA